MGDIFVFYSKVTVWVLLKVRNRFRYLVLKASSSSVWTVVKAYGSDAGGRNHQVRPASWDSWIT